jgi:hypothetical protein
MRFLKLHINTKTKDFSATTLIISSCKLDGG